MDERRAAMAWTRMAEGEDAQAVELVERLGYAEALRWIESACGEGQSACGEEPGACGQAVDVTVQRWLTRYDPQRFESDLKQNVCGFVIPDDAEWPLGLADLGSTRPLGLWYRGKKEVLARTSIAIVGSRDCSSYGAKIAGEWAYEFASKGLVVVSGGAFGIDAHAHRGALAAGGVTIAVTAGGADRFYPASHADLFLDILKHGGAMCSEAAPGTAPHRHRFLSRNRIIAALARVTVVVEAPFRSGALSTAHHALMIGREVGGVPGPITSPRSVGCHRLLREGAVCVTSPEEVLELIGSQQESLFDVQKGDVLDPLAQRVRDALPKRQGVSAASVAQTAGVSMGEALAGLGNLERQGMARCDNGLWRLNASTQR